MNFYEFYWADSNIQSIHIEYDRATLVVWNQILKMPLSVVCSGLAGITNLCIWDDTIIVDAQVFSVDETDSGFVKKIFEVYDKDFDYGGRKLNDGLLELKIELANGISFSIYCMKIQVIESNEH